MKTLTKWHHVNPAVGSRQGAATGRVMVIGTLWQACGGYKV